MSTIKPIVKRGVSILTSGSPAAVDNPKPNGLTIATGPARELHPLPVIHLDPAEATPERLQKQMLDIYESIRKATLAMRQNPMTAPSYVRDVAFTAPSTANVATVPVTVKFLHGLGRAPVNGVTCIHSTGAPYQGYYVPPSSTDNYDPTKYAKITAMVPPGSTATHHFMLSGE